MVWSFGCCEICWSECWSDRVQFSQGWLSYVLVVFSGLSQLRCFYLWSLMCLRYNFQSVSWRSRWKRWKVQNPESPPSPPLFIRSSGLPLKGTLSTVIFYSPPPFLFIVRSSRLIRTKSSGGRLFPVTLCSDVSIDLEEDDVHSLLVIWSLVQQFNWFYSTPSIVNYISVIVSINLSS